MSTAPRNCAQEFAIAGCNFQAERPAPIRAITALLLYELLEVHRSDREDVWWRLCETEVEEKSV